MLSKYGRITDQKYQIFQYKDRILNGDTPTLKIKGSMLKPRQAPRSTSEINELINTRTPERVKVAQEAPRTSYSFCAQGREDYYKSTGPKSPSPPCTKYTCDYSLTSRRPTTPDISNKSKTRSKRKTEADFSHYYDVKPSERVYGPIDFDKQLARPDHILQVNPKRFSSLIEIPKSNQSVEFSRQLGRRDNLFGLSKSLLSYYPSYKLVEKNYGTAILFDKYVARPKAKKAHPMQNLDVSYSTQEKRRPSFDFSKSQGRSESLF